MEGGTRRDSRIFSMPLFLGFIYMGIGGMMRRFLMYYCYKLLVKVICRSFAGIDLFCPHKKEMQNI